MPQFDFRIAIDKDELKEFLKFYEKNNKLNLGCNTDVREGYTNVDLLDDIMGVNLLRDVASLKFIPSESADQILAYDLLEHFPFAEGPEVLAGWVRILKKGGTIIVRVPDMKYIAERLMSGHLPAFEASRLLFGGQDYEFNFHMAGFTPDYLEGLLLGAGCSEVIQKIAGCNESPPSHNITLVARK